MPWYVVVARPDFVLAALSAAARRSADKEHETRAALLRVVSKCPERDHFTGAESDQIVDLRDEAKRCAEHFAAGSRGADFFEEVTAYAQDVIDGFAREAEEYRARPR
jgi:hypothetical protein